MKYYKISFIFCFFLANPLLAQKQAGQLVIGIDIGYSPFFNNLYNPYTDPPINQLDVAGDAPIYSISATPYLGITADYGLLKELSIGIAGGYQSMIMDYNFAGINSSLTEFSDKITRANLAGRLLYHFEKIDNMLDIYFGVRVGWSYWHDTPSAENLIGIGTNSPQIESYLEYQNYRLSNLQALFGIRFYIVDKIGLHFEAGIGAPFLFEGGLTFRVNLKKQKETNK
jgi:hypothetical protein